MACAKDEIFPLDSCQGDDDKAENLNIIFERNYLGAVILFAAGHRVISSACTGTG